MSEEIKNGKMNVAGINIDISSVLGEKIVDQYLARLSEEDMKVILNYIESDFLERNVVTDYQNVLENGNFGTKTIVNVKSKTKDYYGNYKNDQTTIGNLIKNRFNERIKEELVKKIEEIIASKDYQDKIEEIANELVDYSINGYKEDMKNRIRERLVGNVIGTEPYYYGDSLSSIINRIIDERFR